MTATQILVLAVAGLAAFRSLGDLIPWSKLAKLPAAWLKSKAAKDPPTPAPVAEIPIAADRAEAWIAALAHLAVDYLEADKRNHALKLLDELAEQYKPA